MSNPFKYDPKNAFACLPPGDYEATIEGADLGESKSGKPMAVLTYKVYSQRGDTKVQDYIVPEMAWKLKKIAKAIGGEAAFDKGYFDGGDYKGRNLIVTLKVESSDEYGDQNKVTGYKPMAGRPAPRPTAPKPAAVQASSDPEFDDSIPF